jgi:hypothetical protein
MTAADERDLRALICAARLTRIDRATAVLAFTRGFLAAGGTHPEALRAQLEAAGVPERVWHETAAWSDSPVAVTSRAAARASFLRRHDVRTLPR